MRTPGVATAVAFAALLAGAGCESANDRTAADREAFEEAQRGRSELMEADRAFSRATAEEGIDGWVAWFAPRGRMVRGTGEVEGQGAIREAMAQLLSDTTIAFTWEPVRADVGSGGDLGYTVGRYQIRSVVPDTAAAEGSDGEGTPGEPGALLGHGMYLSVWERQPDGSWKVAADIGSPAPLPEEPVEVGEAGADASP